MNHRRRIRGSRCSIVVCLLVLTGFGSWRANAQEVRRLSPPSPTSASSTLISASVTAAVTTAATTKVEVPASSVPSALDIARIERPTSGARAEGPRFGSNDSTQLLAAGFGHDGSVRSNRAALRGADPVARPTDVDWFGSADVGDSLEAIRRRAASQRRSLGRGATSLDVWASPVDDLRARANPELPHWLFAGHIDGGEEPPDFAGTRSLPLFYVEPPRETKLKRKVRKLVRRKIYREFRRQVKKEWKRLFRDSSTMTFATYERTLTEINHIGKSASEYDVFNDDLRTRETQDEVFRREDRGGEAEIPIVTWGPLTITDGGDFIFDVGTAASEGELALDDELEVGGEEARKPLLSANGFDIQTGLQLRFDPRDHSGSGNYVPLVSSYGFSVEVDWLSDVLEREMVTTEFSVEVDRRGEVAGFFNFVIRARK